MGSDSFWRRLLRGIRRLWQRGDWTGLAGVDWSDHIMDWPVTDHYHAKQGRSTGRLVLEKDGRRLAVYLKRHYRLPLLHGFLATLWPGGNWSPAMQECANLDWASAQGLPVPKVVAAGESIGPWGRLQSFLAVEELTDMIALHEAIPLAAKTLSPGKFQCWKAGLIRELARLTRFLHDQHCYHQDLYLCHFFIDRADLANLPCWTGRVHLIDLHRFGRHPWTAWRYQIKDLGQLLYSSEAPGIDDRDRLRFWRWYLDGQTRGKKARLLAWWVRLKAARFRNHNLKLLRRDQAAAARKSA
jgi:heptose I phosphotransferase